MRYDGGEERGGHGMRRKLFGFVSALSLLMCVATVVLWVRSYWRTDTVSHVRVNRSAPNGDINNAGDFGRDINEQRRRQLEWSLKVIF